MMRMWDIYFWRHLAWKAASKHLSEGELKSTWPCSIQKYCRVQRNREFVPVQWEIGSHWPWSEIEAVSAVPHDNTELRQYRSQPGGGGAVGESRTSGRRGKPVSAINTVRKSQAASRWGPWKFRPSTAYSCSRTSSWPMSRLYPVLCLDAISGLGKWALGGIITFLFYIPWKMCKWRTQFFCSKCPECSNPCLEWLELEILYHKVATKPVR